MKAKVILPIIRKRVGATPISFMPNVADDIFYQIYDMAMKLGIWVGNKYIPKADSNQFFIHVDVGASGVLQPIIDLLKTLGWTPFPGYPPKEALGSSYQIRIVREYDEVDLDDAMLLRVSRWGDFEGVIGFKQRSGDRWVGWTNGVGDELQGWNELCRRVDGANNFFAHTKLKNLFEERLQGIRFFPLLWDDPQAALGEYWEIDTPHAMPPCLIPVVAKDDPVVQKDSLKDYEDGPYDPPELVWRRREVEAMGAFDLAWTTEVVGRERPNYGRHYLIVTQTFRRLCRELELPVDFIPTRLVEDDWIPPDPWRDLPFLGPSAPENA